MPGRAVVMENLRSTELGIRSSDDMSLEGLDLLKHLEAALNAKGNGG
jgi:hypothetical protein